MIDIREFVKYHNLVNITDEQIKTLSSGIIHLLDHTVYNKLKYSKLDIIKLLYDRYKILVEYSPYSKNGIISGLVSYTTDKLEEQSIKEHKKLWDMEFPLDIILKTIKAINTGEIDYNYLQVKNGENSYKAYKKAEKENRLRIYETLPRRRLGYPEYCKVNLLREEYYHKLVLSGKEDVLCIIKLKEDWSKENVLILSISKGHKEKEKAYKLLQQKYQKLIDDLDRA